MLDSPLILLNIVMFFPLIHKFIRFLKSLRGLKAFQGLKPI